MDFSSPSQVIRLIIMGHFYLEMNSVMGFSMAEWAELSANHGAFFQTDKSARN